MDTVVINGNFHLMDEDERVTHCGSRRRRTVWRLRASGMAYFVKHLDQNQNVVAPRGSYRLLDEVFVAIMISKHSAIF